MTCTIYMNGHVRTILPSFLAVVVRRVPLPRDLSTMCLPGIHDRPYKLRDGNSNRVTDAQHVEGDSEGSMHVNLTSIFGTRRF